jgi:hypothetical protein
MSKRQRFMYHGLPARGNTVRMAVLLAAVCFLPVSYSAGMESEKAGAFAGLDLRLEGKSVISYQLSTGEHSLVFGEGFVMSIGGNKFSSDKAVVWLKSRLSDFQGRARIDYEAKVYLTGNVSFQETKSGLMVSLRQKEVEDGQSLAVWFEVSGEVFITADDREIKDVRGLELYQKAESVFASIKPAFVIQREAMVPEWVEKKKEPEPVKITEKVEKKEIEKKPEIAKPSFVEKAVVQEKAREVPKEKELKFIYPVHIEPVGESVPVIESARTEDGLDVATIIGRFYLWQKQDEGDSLLELQADRAVVFYSRDQITMDQENADSEDILPRGAIKSIYIAGDVMMAEGSRTIRADEVYYDFENSNAIATNAVMRSFDADRGIPIYVRAAKLRRLSENKFAAEDAVLTSSEFHRPQISATASGVVITDTTARDTEAGTVSDSSYEAEMHDVRFKMGERTIFRWPFIRSNLERPDVPIKKVRMGHDSDWGTSLEVQWYLARLLGLQEPEGVESTLLTDYFSKRGFGAGVDISYVKEDYFGRIQGYAIKDHGKDNLGRHGSREGLEPDKEFRGRLSWRHRHFLPYKWQLTTEINYSSDEYFIESFYRGEFNIYRPETYIHLKNIEGNRAVSILGKWRINNFDDTLEELPTVEYHLVGESFFEDRLTLYSDIQLSRFRQRIGHNHTIQIDEHPFTFMSYRTEVDMPLNVGSVKVVPYIAGTFGYDDRSGFRRTLVDGSYMGQFGSDRVWLTEAGVRIFPRPWWRVYPNVRSRLWDLNQLRHIIQPSVVATVIQESDSVVDQPDMLSVGLSQRLQTKRGPVGDQRTVDWMRLDTDIVWVEDSGGVSDMGPGPDRYIWAKPIVPLRVMSAPQIFHGDLISSLHRFELYGPRRDYFSADYVWRVSDTTAVLSDLNFDMQSGVVQQFNVGISRLCWPNLSYYIGSRYIRRVQVLGEKGSNAFTFAATYILDPRYTVVFSQQFDLDYGENIRSDLTLLRKYHRVSCAFTISVDESLDRQAVMFSIWPEGIKELGIGEKRYMELGGASGY